MPLFFDAYIKIVFVAYVCMYVKCAYCVCVSVCVLISLHEKHCEIKWKKYTLIGTKHNACMCCLIGSKKSSQGIYAIHNFVVIICCEFSITSCDGSVTDCLFSSSCSLTGSLRVHSLVCFIDFLLYNSFHSSFYPQNSNLLMLLCYYYISWKYFLIRF